jgi:hypothetical protein
VAKKMELAELFEAQLKLLHLVRHVGPPAPPCGAPPAAAQRGDLIKAKARGMW